MKKVIAIKDYKAIYEYRNRRQDRLDGKRLDDEWKTIKGTHVMVDDEGSVTKGPESLRNLSSKKQKNLTIGEEMRPINSDYVYEEGDDEQDFTHKNIKKLKPIYDEHGIEACHDEWYKFRLADSTKDIHEITKDEADEVMYDNVRQSTYDGWFRNADSSYKPQLTYAVIKNPEMRNAALNMAYENYKNSVEKPLPFEEFLVTPVKMYRGENGQRHLEDDVFDAYTFDRKMAEHFASKPGKGESKVIEIEVRPIDTYGSMRAVGEAEIWVPRQLSPVGYRGDDPRMDGVDWERYEPIKFMLEEFIAESSEDDENNELLDSIIQEAETIKLFSDKNNEVSKSMVSRCVDTIQRTVLQLMLKTLPSNEDGAFFAGELNGNLGERNVQYPEVEAFRERRQKRLDAKADEDEGRWVTTEENHKIHINEEGVPDKGNPHVINAMESGPSVGSSAKREFNKKLSDIISSSGSFEEKSKRVGDILNELPKGTRIDFPDSWTSDDGTKNYALYEGDGMWRFRYGRGKNDTYLMSSEEVGGYMLDENESERANLTKIPGEKKERPQPVGGGKHKHDGSVVNNHVSDFHNDQVSQEDREFLKNAVESWLTFGSRKYDYYDRRKFYDAGKALADEIKRRHKLRKKDPDDVYEGDEPQVEDIFEALRDIRPFGKPDSFDKMSYDSCLSEERTKAIIKEATDRFPSAWYEAIENGDVKIFIHDMSGRANFAAGLTYASYPGASAAIHLFAKEDPEVLKHLGDKAGEFENKCDVALANELAHELGHYMEWANPEVQDWARRTLSQRTEKSEEEYLEPGYTTKADKFFTSYMGKQYPYGYTEITSCLMQRLGYLNPFETISGKDFGASSKDPESLKYILGILGGL